MGFVDRVEEVLDTLCLLISKAEIAFDCVRDYRGLKEGFTLWQQYCKPQYYETALEERVDLAISFTALHRLNGPELFRTALARNHIPHLAVAIRNRGCETLLHAVGRSLGKTAKYIVWKPFPYLDMISLPKLEGYFEGKVEYAIFDSNQNTR